MAIRIHVTAARGSAAEEVRAVFTGLLGAGFADVDLHEHNGWVWFATSVWGVSGSDLNRGLCQLARPGLQFTTSDGDRWYLAVYGGGAGKRTGPAGGHAGPPGQQHYLHEFGYHSRPASPDDDAARAAALDEESEPPPVDPELAFLEEDPVPGEFSRPKSPFDLVADQLAGLGGAVPESFRAEVAHLPYSAALNRYREWHAEQIQAALAAAQIPHDPVVLRPVLLWENVTDVERDSDLGNLPRLLAALGLGGEWDDWVRQAENPPEPEPEEEPAPLDPLPRPDYANEVLWCVAPLPLEPVQGGPVPLPLRHMARVAFFAEACSTGAAPAVAFRIQPPRGFDLQAVLPPKELMGAGQVAITPHPEGERIQIGLMNSMWLGGHDLRRLLGKKLAGLLLHLPHGTILEAAFAAEGQRATYQRYRGRVEAETWRIDATQPPLSHEVLGRALELAAAETCTTHRARDAAEAEAVMLAVRKDGYLHNMGVVREGLTIGCEYDHGQLATLFFRHRFREHWDFGPAEQEAEKEYRDRLELQKRLRKAAVAAARQREAPHEQAVLLEGEHSRYWRSDFTQLTELEQETRERFDAELAALGFEHVGDLVAKKQRDVVLRVFASADRRSYGILMGKRTMYLGYEFFSRFADDSTLTTTTNPAVESHPEAGIYYKAVPGLEAAALHAKHLWGIDRFRERRATEPQRLEPTLVGVAREIDHAFARRVRAGP
jgi:hypothetical protein